MSAPARLVAFAAVLTVLFGASYVIAGAVVPERVVQDWTRSAEQDAHDEGDGEPHDVGTPRPAPTSTTSSTGHGDQHEGGS